MGLYLCVVDNDEEIEGVEVGSYADFDFFRSSIAEMLESGETGSLFPTLNNHSDSDGEWSTKECVSLKAELGVIENRLRLLPTVPFHAEWQRQVARLQGLSPSEVNRQCNRSFGFQKLDGTLGRALGSAHASSDSVAPVPAARSTRPRDS